MAASKGARISMKFKQWEEKGIYIKYCYRRMVKELASADLEGGGGPDPPGICKAFYITGHKKKIVIFHICALPQ